MDIANLQENVEKIRVKEPNLRLNVNAGWWKLPSHFDPMGGPWFTAHAVIQHGSQSTRTHTHTHTSATVLYSVKMEKKTSFPSSVDAKINQTVAL